MNLQETNPIAGRDRLTAIETAVTADETALGQTATGTSFCDLATVQLAAPLNLAVTQGGTAGSTNYSYVIADCGNGNTFAPCTAVQTTTGNATLTALAYNIVSFASIPGHTYNIYRSASSGTPSGTGLIGTLTAAAGVLSLTLNDTALTGTGNVPTVNTTGAIVPAGPVFASTPVLVGANVQTISSTATTAALSVAQVTNQLLVFTGGTVVTAATMPTAAALVAALPGVKINQGIRLVVRNNNSGSVTLAVTTGGTSATNNTLATISLHSKDVFIQFTGVASGSEAFVLYTVSDSAS